MRSLEANLTDAHVSMAFNTKTKMSSDILNTEFRKQDLALPSKILNRRLQDADV
jgi:hypothetical protein